MVNEGLVRDEFHGGVVLTRSVDMKNARGMAMAAALGLALAGGSFVVSADDGATRVKRVVDSARPDAAAIEAALFPEEVVRLREECAKMEEAGLRCQSVIPKSALDTVSVTFERGSAALTNQGKGFLRAIGGALVKRGGAWDSLVIEGHADSTGTDGANRRISLDRALAAKGFLEREFGVSGVEAQGLSSSKPRDAQNPEGSVNRRLEFVVDKR